jgi:hypothetical protein
MTTEQKQLAARVEQAKQKLSSLPTARLCEMYVMTNGIHTDETPTVRGWLMDELESRNPTAFENWMLCEDVERMEDPASFF